VRVDAPREGVEVHCEGAVLGDGRTLRRQDGHSLRLLSCAVEVEVAELVGHELQAFETKGLVGVEVRNVPESTGAVDGELQTPKADGASKDFCRRVDVEGHHRAIMWW
jgi:hypothetical protein